MPSIPARGRFAMTGLQLSPARSEKRRGFTLIELLVVIAMVAVIMGMLIPAVQRVREAAERAQCSNNLKQIGLALHNYSDTFRFLPPGTEDPSPGAGPTRANWAIRLLPFLELKSLADQYQNDLYNADERNGPVRQAYVKVFNCPSDPNTGQYEKPATGPGIGTENMTSNYRAMAGRSDGFNFFEFINNPPGQAPSAKILDYKWRGPMHIVMPQQGLSVESLSAISSADGTGNTILVGEYATATAPKRRVMWAYSFSSYSVGSAVPDSRTLIPDFDRCAFTLGAGELACARGWSSYHAGGRVINFVMCDGSVRPISNGIQVDIFAGLGSIDGGEEIPNP